MDAAVRGQRWNGSGPVNCDAGLRQRYRHLCEVWGVLVQTLAALGFVTCAGLMLALLMRPARACRRRAAALLLFLLGTAGVFALTSAFVVSASAETCAARAFLFGVSFSAAFGALLARALALLATVAERGWREVGVGVVLALVQVIIATERLLVALVRNETPCEILQPEFATLQIYVMVLLAAALMLALRFLCNVYVTYSYSYTGQTRRHAKLQAVLLVLTLLLSACIWLVWILLLTYGNSAMGRSPDWDDPVISIALTANGWVLLLGHGFTQVLFLCRGEVRDKDPALEFTGWTNSTEPAAQNQPRTGRDNSAFQLDLNGGRDEGVESPEITMTEISAVKDYSIPRPTATNISEAYDDYYEQSLRTHTHTHTRAAAVIHSEY